jgi:type II secretory pathway component GspD/PulD (secretin)
MSINLELTDPGGMDTVTDTVTLKNILASEIEPFITFRLSKYGTVQVNDALNMLIITDMQNKVTDLIKVAKKLDVKGISNFLKVETAVIPVNNVQASDIAGLLYDRLTPGAPVRIDSAMNALIITDVKSKLDQAKALIQLLDVPSRQVMIEARIIELQNDRDAKTGVDWRSIFQSAQITGDTMIGATASTGNTSLMASGGGSAKATFSMNGVDAIIGVLEKDGRARLLASPRIVASNNRAAYINTGDQIYYTSDSRSIGGGSNSGASVGSQTQYYPGVTDTSSNMNISDNVSNSTNRNISSGYINTGINLNVTPHIVSSDLVTIDLNAAVNNLSGWSPQGNPVVMNRTANSTITIKNGEAFVMGGLKKDMLVKSTDKVPFLGDIPVLGFFFSSDKEMTVTNDIVIVIMPMILAEQGKNMPAEDKEKIEKSAAGVK